MHKNNTHTLLQKITPHRHQKKGTTCFASPPGAHSNPGFGWRGCGHTSHPSSGSIYWSCPQTETCWSHVRKSSENGPWQSVQFKTHPVTFLEAFSPKSNREKYVFQIPTRGTRNCITLLWLQGCNVAKQRRRHGKGRMQSCSPNCYFGGDSLGSSRRGYSPAPELSSATSISPIKMAS